MAGFRWLCRVVAAAVGLAVLAGTGYAVFRVWPRELPAAARTPLPAVDFAGDRIVLRPAEGFVAGQVARFTDGVSSFLHFEYLRGRPALQGSRVLLSSSEVDGGPVYRILVLLPTDLCAAVERLSELRASRLIGEFSISILSGVTLRDLENQTSLFLAAYNLPPGRRLEDMSDERVLPAMARYILFKSQTDRRVRQRIAPVAAPLSLPQAHRLAADIIAVAHFYSLPLDMFLGIGAMENNYMAFIGDWEHTRWKKRAEPGDIVVKRRGRRVLVWNYSQGVWQITRETLRRAHELYRKDQRDYAALPERLRPPHKLNLDHVDDAVLTTYAGLLLRSLLDHFGGDVERAVGAYNGGIARPNLAYAGGVSRVAEHARKVLEHAAAPVVLATAEAATSAGAEPSNAIQ